MHDEVRRAPILRIARRVPDGVVLAIVPKRTVLVVLDEENLIRGVRAELIDLPIVRDQRLEPVAQLLPLDPVHAEPAKRRTRRDRAIRIRPRHVRFDVVEQGHEVAVRRAAPVVGDGVGEVLPVRGRAGELGYEDDEALLGPETHVPAGAPRVALGGLRAAVDLEDHGPLGVGREVGRVVHEGLDLRAVTARVPEVCGRVGKETGELGVDFVGGEERLRGAVEADRVPELGGPGGGCGDKGVA